MMAIVLLEAGADVNVQDDAGETALMWAARWGHEKTARELLAQGARMYVKNKDGQTALNLAKAEGHSELVALLQQHSPLKLVPKL